MAQLSLEPFIPTIKVGLVGRLISRGCGLIQADKAMPARIKVRFDEPARVSDYS
jgi:hypothetical protein